MPAPGYLNRVAGRFKQLLALQTSAGAADADKIVSTGADGRLDLSLLPSGTGPLTKAIVASEALAANDLVNLWNDAGTIKARKADADSAGMHAHGFVKAAFAAAATATVYFNSEISGLTGKTPGAYQYLGAAAGTMVETPPTGAGVISQIVGVATSATTVQFELFEPVELAA